MGYIDSKINNIVIISCQEDRNYSGNIRFERSIRDAALYPIFKYFKCAKNSKINNNSYNPNNLKHEKRNEVVIRALGGDGVVLENKRLQSLLCSLGFWVKDNHNKNYFGLADDCYVPGAQAYLIPDSIDTILFIEDLIEVSSNGVHLCHSGINSHVECGYVEALNGFAAEGEAGVFTDIVISSMIGIGGDSGGPAFSYKQDQKYVSLNGIFNFVLGNFINGTLSEIFSGSTTINSILSSVSDDINITIPTVSKTQ
ncbi:hypothetical protein C2G38_2176447 [Gigaspora rosea]|uniref:Peptidase S1 domain-containing protein n=1 Tax=Gigaspora rosea TaxID=44941 RepID=A0A397VGB9_9GLOM|nr:hypothetical protein C2G38_2176447 [Gigaspora rosea]